MNFESRRSKINLVQNSKSKLDYEKNLVLKFSLILGMFEVVFDPLKFLKDTFDLFLNLSQISYLVKAWIESGSKMGPTKI